LPLNFIGERHLNKKILILTFNYPPDLGAGSFKVAALVSALREIEPEAEIDIVTTSPNRYSVYDAEFLEHERHKGLSVTRIHLPKHGGGIIGQIRAFTNYAVKVPSKTGSNYNLVFATSSRLMTAVVGAFMSRKLRCPFYLDIRDIFPDTIDSLLPSLLSKFLKPLLSSLERWVVSRAGTINLVSEGFRNYFQSRYPAKRLTFFTNGIDDEFLIERECQHLFRSDSSKHRLKILYAGNIGDGQALHEIVPYLALQMKSELEFKIFGYGGRRDELLRRLSSENILNVSVADPIHRGDLISHYEEADVLFVHLADFEAFKKVLPSKIFEYAATGKPIWAGVSGYCAGFLKREVPNCAIFHPGDVSGAMHAFQGLEMKSEPRLKFMRKFSRRRICYAMAQDILELARNKKIT
jgi:glycosyltransferase involved in cell wall biosynthesis